MKNSHDDAKLNSLIGKNVNARLIDGSHYTGKLERDPDGMYRINNLHFYKSHIKKTEGC